jgi:hypothetical protein
LRKGKSNQKLLSLKRASFDVADYVGYLNADRICRSRPSGGKELAGGSNSFSTDPMDIGMSGCS